LTRKLWEATTEGVMIGRREVTVRLLTGKTGPYGRRPTGRITREWGGDKRQTIRRRPLEGASKTNCGDCATCRNPKAKQACRRREVLQDGAGPGVCLVEEAQLPSSPNQESLAAAEFRESRLERLRGLKPEDFVRRRVTQQSKIFTTDEEGRRTLAKGEPTKVSGARKGRKQRKKRKVPDSQPSVAPFVVTQDTMLQSM
jgi:hypothetical protein